MNFDDAGISVKRECPRWLALTFAAWMLVLCVNGPSVAAEVEAAGPKRVLILHSFGRDFAPFNTIAPAFRTSLAKQSREPIAFFENSLDVERPMSPDAEASLIALLRARYGAMPPNLVVPIGGPATQFYLSNRNRLFGDVPVLAAGLEERRVQEGMFGARDVVVPIRLELPSIVENILQLLPLTESIVVVLGNSALDQFWLKQLQTELAQYSARVKFVWINDLPLERLLERVAKLPPRSAIFYGMLTVDGAGVPHANEEALNRLRSAANAPIFGIFESQLGKGIVGGALMPMERVGTIAGEIGHVLLADSSPSPELRYRLVRLGTPTYDFRELQRHGISMSRLPPASELRFRPPTLWQEHRAMILTVVSILLLQAVLIAALLVQRAQRRNAESEARTLSGRLLRAHEEERARLAHHLHDDFSQRLARLAIDAASLERAGGSAATDGIAREMRLELVHLSEDIHSLSYRLHPARLRDLGLVVALKAECDHLCRQESIPVGFNTDVESLVLSPDVALCLFRIAQESLQNVVRHAGASVVEVTLKLRGRGLQLEVHDNGCGFIAVQRGADTRLGLAGMRERVRLAGGKLRIDSTPGQGTTIQAWVPLKGEPS